MDPAFVWRGWEKQQPLQRRASVAQGSAKGTCHTSDSQKSNTCSTLNKQSILLLISFGTLKINLANWEFKENSADNLSGFPPPMSKYPVKFCIDERFGLCSEVQP